MFSGHSYCFLVITTLQSLFLYTEIQLNIELNTSQTVVIIYTCHLVVSTQKMPYIFPWRFSGQAEGGPGQRVVQDRGWSRTEGGPGQRGQGLLWHTAKPGEDTKSCRLWILISNKLQITPLARFVNPISQGYYLPIRTALWRVTSVR